MLAAIIAGIGLLGFAVWYVENIKSSVAVMGVEFRFFQKEHETSLGNVREQIRKFEDGVGRRLGDLESAIRGQQPNQEPAKHMKRPDAGGASR